MGYSGSSLIVGFEIPEKRLKKWMEENNLEEMDDVEPFLRKKYFNKKEPMDEHEGSSDEWK